MAAITEKTRGNQVVSFKFTACIGRDEQGKQKYKTAVWKPPEGITANKARKLAEAEAEACRWEQEIKNSGAPVPQGEYIKAPAPQTPLFCGRCLLTLTFSRVH